RARRRDSGRLRAAFDRLRRVRAACALQRAAGKRADRAGVVRVTTRLADQASGKHQGMLRKLLWTGLYGGLAAGATLAARRTASAIWRVATGEAPPAKR